MKKASTYCIMYHGFDLYSRKNKRHSMAKPDWDLPALFSSSESCRARWRQNPKNTGVYNRIHNSYDIYIYVYYRHVVSIYSLYTFHRGSLASRGLQEIREAFALQLSVAPSQLQLLTTATNFEELGDDEVQVPRSKTQFFLFTNIGFPACR